LDSNFHRFIEPPVLICHFFKVGTGGWIHFSDETKESGTMDESTLTTQARPAADIHNKGSSNGMAWLMLLVMFIGFAGAAYYIDYRLTSLESKVLTQAGDVSKQTEDTLQAIQNARKDILGNRAESAEFAQKFSTTLTDMSALVTESVQAFTQQTSKLTQAIESQDQNQRDFLQVLASNLTQEAAATREAVREAHGQSQAVERHVAALARQVEQNSQEMQDGLRQLGQEFASGFTSMSEWSQQMNTVLSSRLDEQARILNQHLSALREDSQRSLNRIESHLAVINTETQTGRSNLETIASEGLAQLEGKLAGYAEDLRNETHGVETTLANQVDTLVDTLRAGLLEQKGAISDLHSLIGDQTQALAEELQLGFAGGKESVEILRDDIQEMEYALHGRTEDLWLEVAALKQAQDQTAERTAVAVTTGLQSLSQAIAGLESAVEDTRSLTASSRELIEQWTSRESRRDQDFAAALEILTQTRLAMESTNVQLGNLGQRVDTIHGDLVTQLETVRQALAAQIPAEGTDREEYRHAIQGLQTLTAEIRTLHDALKSGIEAVRRQAATWMETPESEDARAAFQTILDDLVKSLESTQGQVEAIQKEISSLATQFVPAAGAEPIGMVPASGVAESSP